LGYLALGIRWIASLLPTLWQIGMEPGEVCLLILLSKWRVWQVGLGQENIGIGGKRCHWGVRL